MDRTARLRTLALVVGTLSLAFAATSPALAVTPVAGGSLDLTIYPINVGPTDAFDGHVSRYGFATYTADSRVRYYDFGTGNDAAVPAPAGSTDLLSDIGYNRVLFSRFAEGSARIQAYDIVQGTTTEVDPQEGSVLRLGSALDSNTVAFIDQTVASRGELKVAVLGGTTTLLADGSRFNQNPSVAPGGTIIVFESCANDPSDCEVRQAEWGSFGWGVRSNGYTTYPGANPDSDGFTIAYDTTEAGDRNIRWRSVDFGPEQVLELPGEQRNPAISNGVVVFDSVAPGQATADLWLYEIATARLFQITSTPADESLSDIAVQLDGSFRIVWATGSLGDRDLYGAQFRLPPVGPTYSFGGFLQPVDARPTLNSLKAGAAVPVKFSLGGDRGLDIFASGYPRSQVIACDSTASVDGIETTVTAGGSGLTYDPATGLYTYVWKSDKSWKGTCRQLVLGLADGSIQRANFIFN